jgi:hypothetical protein
VRLSQRADLKAQLAGALQIQLKRRETRFGAELSGFFHVAELIDNLQGD